MKIALIIVVCFLTACITQPTPEQRAAQAKAYWAALGSQCAGMGLQYGTADYANCVQSLNAQEQQRRMAIAGMMMQNMQNNKPAPIPFTPMVVPQTINTNCVTNGNTTNCTSR